MLITENVLKNLCPYGKTDIIRGVVEHFNTLAPTYGVDTYLRICHFFAQAAVETDWFKTLQEYASGAEYEGRTDLGNVNYGDGVRYKGRGIFQVTGRYNYDRIGRMMGLDLINNPGLLLEPRNSVMSALLYWQSRNLNIPADNDDVRTVTKLINGGYNGLNNRISALEKLKATLNNDFVGPNSPLDLVKDTQSKLKKLNYPVGVVDGLYGRATTHAVRLFQSDNDLPMTGIADKATLEKLEFIADGRQ